VISHEALSGNLFPVDYPQTYYLFLGEDILFRFIPGHFIPELSNTAIEGISLDLKAHSLHPFGNFWSM